MLEESTYTELYAKMVALYRVAFADILLSEQHLEQMSRDSLSEKRAVEVLTTLEERTGQSIRGKKMLEVGAGVCMTLATARLRFGAESFGIEPSDEEYNGSMDLGRSLLTSVGLPDNLVTEGVGEAIPFADGEFDLVFSWNVLEHTQDPGKVLAESLRVLRPGGLMYHVVPNYGSWWEGHYGVPWIPHLNHFLGRLYLRILRKNPSYLDTLQLISRGWVKRMLRPFRNEIEILSWGQDLFQTRLKTLDFAEYAALGRLKKILKICRRLGLIWGIRLLGRLFHWETPLIITVRKRRAATSTHSNTTFPTVESGENIAA